MIAHNPAGLSTDIPGQSGVSSRIEVSRPHEPSGLETRRDRQVATGRRFFIIAATAADGESARSDFLLTDSGAPRSNSARVRRPLASRRSVMET